MSGKRFDTAIIGAGSAGCVLAARLSEDPKRSVLLLEAGPDQRGHTLPDELRFLGRPVDWPYEWDDSVTSIRGRTLRYLRGRGVGGSSATNGCVAIRPEPADFEGWPSGWSWDDLLPHFRRLERDLDFPDSPWHGAAGPVPIVRYPRREWSPHQAAFHDACLAEGFPECADHNAPGTTGIGPIPMNRIGGERVSAARAYLEPARDRANLFVRADAHVGRVKLDGKRAVGIELTDAETVLADEVILSAGVVQNPLLLLRSGIGPTASVCAIGCEPTVPLPAVGANWSDHFVVNLSVPIDRDLVSPGAPGIQTLLRTTARGSDRTHDLQLTPWVQRASRDELELVISVSLQRPEGSGRVSARSARADEAASIDWPFVGRPENLRRVAEGLRLAARVVARAQLLTDSHALAPWLERTDAELEEHVAVEHQAFYHGVGTCRLGEPADDGAVVDPECRVHETDGLRVVDASIVPWVPRSNTNILVMAVAERAVEFLR